jgi:hypothetical protein
MMPINYFRSGGAAVALAFSPLAHAAGLIDDNNSVNKYRPAFSEALAQAAGNKEAHLRAGGFMVELEKTLKEPSEKLRVVDYPARANAELLRVIAVVPPKGFEALPIPVCAEQNNKVLGTWNITAKGEVQPALWTGAMVSERPTSSACKAFILTARAEINQRMSATTESAENSSTVTK